MPKAKTQGIVFGILMSFFMTYGMEVYNTSIRMGFNLAKGLGFSSISYAVFWGSAERSCNNDRYSFYSFKPYWQQGGRGFYEKALRPRKGQPIFLPTDAAGRHGAGDVPANEPYSLVTFSDNSRRYAADPPARDMGRHAHQKFPDGFFLEYVRRRPAGASDIRQMERQG